MYSFHLSFTISTVLFVFDVALLVIPNVCFPNGTTIEAIHVMETNNVKGTMMQAVKVCAEKSSK